ncbi:MAG TPA: GGDEF domain-containing protein [Sandaracinaceae bacterium LLY-WYZ-13_1]|nr:GGDEF domain-containing protein [Sandaracinaceae bacterium LLY-WYZ-13_1]
MSLFGARRPRPAQDDSELPDLQPGQRRLSGGGGARPSRRPTGDKRALAAAAEALGEALRLLRRSGDAATRDEVGALEEAAGRARLAPDYFELADRIRALRPRWLVPEGGDGALATELLHRVVFGAQPLAQAFGLEAAHADLAELLLVPHLASVEERPVRRLLRVFETFALHATRTQEGASLIKRCVAEIIETLGQLAEDEADHGAQLGAIRARLETAEEIGDLEQLREALLAQVGTLVEAATSREGAVREALGAAQQSQQRARELEAALTDAEAQARTDALTGLGNRRALSDAVADAASRPGDTGVILLDLDHFKAINDRWGHAVGDGVLRHLARLLRGELRGDDQAFRVGGEEIVVLLPDGTWQGTRATAERLRARLERTPVPVGGDLRVAATMSVGLSLWAAGADFEAVLEEADQALYRAKRAGRNRVVG